MTSLSRGTDRKHTLQQLTPDEVRDGSGNYVLVRIGEDDEEHVKLALGKHTLVLTIAIDEIWRYRVSLPITDLLNAIQHETHRIGH